MERTITKISDDVIKVSEEITETKTRVRHYDKTELTREIEELQNNIDDKKLLLREF